MRNLAREPIPHLDATRVAALFSRPEDRAPKQQVALDESDGRLAEFEVAEVVVHGLPLYNVGIPSTLRAYFDHIARAGVRFRYTPNGSEGLLRAQMVCVLAARTSHCKDTPADTQTPHVAYLLNFFGIRDIVFVYAEGVNVSAEANQQALDRARSDVERLAAWARRPQPNGEHT